MARLFGTDGVRGVANDSLTPELAYHLGRAAAGARYGTMSDRTPQEGMERTRQMIEGVLPSSYAENISYHQSSDSTGVRTMPSCGVRSRIVP